MQREVISDCPVCDSPLTVTRLHCNTCGTTIEGEFSVGRFSRLNREQYALLESFLRSRGNLRELERELGVSYPTVRNRVEALLRALDLADGTPMPAEAPRPESAAPTVDPETRRAILERLARHELTAEQAAAALRGEQIAVPVPAAPSETTAPEANEAPEAAEAAETPETPEQTESDSNE